MHPNVPHEKNLRESYCFVANSEGDRSIICLFIFEIHPLCLRAVVLQDLFPEHIFSLDRKVQPGLFCFQGRSDRRLWNFWGEFKRKRAGSEPLCHRKIDERKLKVNLPLTVFCVEVDFL